MHTRTATSRPVGRTVRLAALTLPAGTFSLLGAAAFADAGGGRDLQPTVTVQAPRVVERKSVGGSGFTVEQLSMTRIVSFADLNLDTPEGKAALHARILRTAQRACQELPTLYPSLSFMNDMDSCVTNAMLTWMPRLRRTSTALR